MDKDRIDVALCSAAVPFGVREVVKKLGPAETPFDPWTEWAVIWGETGSGKSVLAARLLAALAGGDDWWRKLPTQRPLWISWLELVEERRWMMGRKGQPDDTDPAIGVASLRGPVVLDDVGAERVSDFSADTLNLILSRRYDQRLPTILTTNLQYPEDFQTVYGARLTSRLREVAHSIAKVGDLRQRA